MILHGITGNKVGRYLSPRINLSKTQSGIIAKSNIKLTPLLNSPNFAKLISSLFESFAGLHKSSPSSFF